MIDLQPFCYTGEDRKYLQKPFSFGEHTYATNSHIMVRVARRDDVPENTAAPKSAVKMFDKYLVGEFVAAPGFLFQPFEPVEYECEECGNSGTTAEKSIVTIRGVIFSARYCRQLFALPGLQLPVIVTADARTNDPMPFKFSGGNGGGDGLLMSMRRDYENGKSHGEVFPPSKSGGV
jgi:hypothetical protein